MLARGEHHGTERGLPYRAGSPRARAVPRNPPPLTTTITTTPPTTTTVVQGRALYCEFLGESVVPVCRAGPAGRGPGRLPLGRLCNEGR